MQDATDKSQVDSRYFTSYDLGVDIIIFLFLNSVKAVLQPYIIRALQ